jgi:hypothetical protein
MLLIVSQYLTYNATNIEFGALIFQHMDFWRTHSNHSSTSHKLVFEKSGLCYNHNNWTDHEKNTKKNNFKAKSKIIFTSSKSLPSGIYLKLK